MPRLRRLLPLLCAAFLLTAASPSVAAACTKEFTGGSESNKWSVQENWAGNSFPAPGDTVCIGVDSIADRQLSVSSITFASGEHILGTAGLHAFGTTPLVTVQADATVNQIVAHDIPGMLTNFGTWNAHAPVAGSSGTFLNHGAFVAQSTTSITVAPAFRNLDTVTFLHTNDNNNPTLHFQQSTADVSKGTYQIVDAPDNQLVPQIRLTGARLESATLGAQDRGFYSVDGATNFYQVIKDAPLTFGNGTITLGSSPFDLDDSTERTLTYQGGTLAGSFTIPEGWTFLQENPLALGTNAVVTNAGTWTTTHAITGSSARLVIAPTGKLQAQLASSTTFQPVLQNQGLVVVTPLGNVAVTFAGDLQYAHSGTFTVTGTDPVTVNLNGPHAFDTDATLSTSVLGQTYNLNGVIEARDLTLDAPTTFVGGTFTGGNHATMLHGTGPFTFTSLNGMGDLHVGPELELRPTGVATTNRHLINTGTISLDAATSFAPTSGIKQVDGGRFIRTEAGTSTVTLGSPSDLTDGAVIALDGTIAFTGAHAPTIPLSGHWQVLENANVTLPTTDLRPVTGQLSFTAHGAFEGPSLEVAETGNVDLTTGQWMVDELITAGRVDIGGTDPWFGSIEVTDTGTLAVDLDASSPGSITAEDAASIDGTLELTGLGSTPAWSYRHAVITSPTIAGAFDDVTVDPALDAPRRIALVRGTDSVDVTVTEDAAPTVPTLQGSVPLANALTRSSAITLTWTATDAGSGIAGYRTGIGTSASVTPTSATSPAASATFGSLASGTYWIAVSAVDAVGNESAPARFGPFRLDTTPPGAVAATALTPQVNVAIEGTTVEVAWSAATDNVGVASYRVGISTSRGAAPSTTTTSRSATFSSVAPGSWWVAVRAVDAAGNLGPILEVGPFVLKRPDRTPPKVGPIGTPKVSSTGVMTLKAPMCPKAERRCRGVIKLQTTVPRSLLRAKRPRPKLTTVSLGTIRYAARSGAAPQLKLALSKRNRTLLQRAGSLKVVAQITVTDQSGNATKVKRTFTIKAPRKKR